MRPSRPLLFALLLASTGGCRSDLERCVEAQTASETAWQRYLDVLDRELTESLQTKTTTHIALAEVELRLSEQVKREVDQRRDRWDPAWMRAYDAALIVACRADATCRALREKEAEAKVRIESTTPRVEAVRRVLAVTREMPSASGEAAASVDADGAHPELVPARRATREVVEACEGVTAPRR